MSPSREETIERFNEYVNMTSSELKEWLETPESKEVGWSSATNSKHDPEDTDDESVGHKSGRTIVSILEANPNKDADKYTDEHIEHMRKVVAYCARHLAQESSLAERKTKEELEEAKSTKSLKNWGHDPVKATKGDQGNDSEAKGKGKGKGKAAEPEPEQEDNDQEEDDDDEAENDRGQYGRKRKRTEPYTEEELNEGADDDDSEDDDFEAGDDDDEDAAVDSDESESEAEDSEDDNEEEEEEEKAASSKGKGKAPAAKKAKK